MAILGVYEGHNACAALVDSGGGVLAAVEEERFSRVKNHDGREPALAGPVESIRFCLAATTEPIDSIALALEEPASLQRRAINEYLTSIRDGDTSRLSYDGIGDRFLDYFELLDWPRESQATRVAKVLLTARDAGVDVGAAETRHVPHHTAHAAAAFLGAPVESALILTLDGKGDGLCGLIARGEGSRVTPLHQIDFRHSIGHLYGAATAACGHLAFRDEGKVTALAAHGEVDDGLYARLASWYSVDRSSGALTGRFNEGLGLGPYPDTPVAAQLGRFRTAARDVAPADIAATVQRFTEDLVLELLEHFVRATDIATVAVAGGLFANVGLNRRIASMSWIDELYVHPAMSDAGLGVGAALHTFSTMTGARPQPVRHAFLGPSFSEDEIAAAFSGFQMIRPDSMPDAIARALAMGKPVARFTGRAEYGPRALGHRSLLASPRDPSMCDRLNAQLKRSGIMPFAPITRSEDASELYTNLSSASWSSEFMTVSFDCSHTMIREAPAAVHRDGTARPQVLHPRTDPELYQILTAHRSVTGISSAINTSLNLHEEPMALSPSDARHCIASAGIEVAQVGDVLCCSSPDLLDVLIGTDAIQH